MTKYVGILQKVSKNKIRAGLGPPEFRKTATLTTHVTWKSSDSTIASVDALGLLTALKAGAVTVTTTEGATSGALGINVTPTQVTPTSISVTISAAYGGGTPRAMLSKS